MSYTPNELLTDFLENVTNGKGMGRKYETNCFLYISHNYFRKLDFLFTKYFFISKNKVYIFHEKI